MDNLLGKFSGRCFPENKCIQRIVRREVLKSKNSEKRSKVDTLALMAIKSIMYRELLADEKLIFKDPIGFLDDYSQRAPEWKPSAFFRRNRPRDTEPVDDQQFHQYLTDGDIVFALLNLEILRFYDGEIGIVITRNNLQICINWHFIAVIPHRDGIEYDSFWAEKFLKMMLPKYPKCVSLEVNKEGPFADLDNDQEMPNYVDLILAKLPRVVPPEGWEEYISIDRPVYHKDGGSTSCPSQFGYSFNWHATFRSRTNYSNNYWNNYYWGCLGEE